MELIKASLMAAVCGGGGANLGTKTITQNGTYAASDDSLDGYSEVTVNVPTQAGGDLFSDIVALPTLKSVDVGGVTISLKAGNPIARQEIQWGQYSNYVSGVMTYQSYVAYIYSYWDLFMVVGDTYAERLNYGSVGSEWAYTKTSSSSIPNIKIYLYRARTNPWVSISDITVEHSDYPGVPRCRINATVYAGWHYTYFGEDGSIQSEGDDEVLKGSSVAASVFPSGSSGSMITNKTAREYAEAAVNFYSSECGNIVSIP